MLIDSEDRRLTRWERHQLRTIALRLNGYLPAPNPRDAADEIFRPRGVEGDGEVPGSGSAAFSSTSVSVR